MSRIVIEPASPDDLATISALLQAAQLPLAGLEAQFPAAYVLARRDHRVVGVAGLELYGDVGLLRSVAVSETARGGGVATALVRERLEAARQRRLERVYLLTTTAGAYFERLGFTAAVRDEAPQPLRLSEEFARACPGSALCLSRVP